MRRLLRQNNRQPRPSKAKCKSDSYFQKLALFAGVSVHVTLQGKANSQAENQKTRFNPNVRHFFNSVAGRRYCPPLDKQCPTPKKLSTPFLFFQSQPSRFPVKSSVQKLKLFKINRLQQTVLRKCFGPNICRALRLPEKIKFVQLLPHDGQQIHAGMPHNQQLVFVVA